MREEPHFVDDVIEVDLPYDLTAGRVARAVLAQWGANVEADVVVSELALNAVQHGLPPISLRAIRTPDVVHIEIADALTALGCPRADSIGLRIVEAYSTAWGVNLDARGRKSVWAEFPA